MDKQWSVSKIDLNQKVMLISVFLLIDMKDYFRLQKEIYEQFCLRLPICIIFVEKLFFFFT